VLHEKRPVRRRFQEAGAQQNGALDSFLQKRDNESSAIVVEENESVEKDTKITLPSTSTQVLAEHEPEPTTAVVACHHGVQRPEAQLASHVIVNDPALWDVDDYATVEYWVRAGPSTCRHRDGVYENSVRKPEKGSARRLRDAAFSTVSPNGETVDRIWLLYSPSTGKVLCFVCKLLAWNKSHSQLANSGFDSWTHIDILREHE